MTTQVALGQLISKWHDAVLEEDAKTVEEVRTKPKDPRYNAERLKAGAFFNHMGLTRTALRNEFPDRWDGYMSEKAAARKRPSDAGTTSK